MLKLLAGLSRGRGQYCVLNGLNVSSLPFPEALYNGAEHY